MNHANLIYHCGINMKGNLLSSEEGSGQEAAYDYSGDEVEESSVDATDMDTRSGNVFGSNWY